MKSKLKNLLKTLPAAILLFVASGCASDGRMAQYPQYYLPTESPIPAPVAKPKPEPRPVATYVYEQRVWGPVTAYTPPEQFTGGTASGWYKPPAQDPIASPTNFGSTLGVPNYSAEDAVPYYPRASVPLFQGYYISSPRVYYPEEYYNSSYYNTYYPATIGLEWRSGLHRGYPRRHHHR